MNETLTFEYSAMDRGGTRTRGTVRAGSQAEALRQVRASGLQPLKISPVRPGRGRGRRVTIKDLSHFTYQFSVLMDARISIIDGLRSIAEQETNPRLREVIEDVASRIQAGHSVTDSLMPHRDLFGEVYIETLRAAERSGSLTQVLASQAEMLDREYDMRKNVRGAMMYPICVVAALTLAVTFLMIFVVPKFASMFASRGMDLPVPTRILIGASAIMRGYWPLILGLGGAAAFGLRALWRSPKGRARIDRALHRLPFMRSLLTGIAVSRFVNVLGICLRSGLSLIDALEMSGRASGRPLLQADAQKMQDQVKQGRRLAEVLLACSYLPSFTRRMLTAGEEAAELPKMCSIVGRHYDREVSHLAKNVTTVIEPIMIMGLAGIVLLVALAIFLPMWNMAALVG